MLSSEGKHSNKTVVPYWAVEKITVTLISKVNFNKLESAEFLNSFGKGKVKEWVYCWFGYELGLHKYPVSILTRFWCTCLNLTGQMVFSEEILGFSASVTLLIQFSSSWRHFPCFIVCPNPTIFSPKFHTNIAVLWLDIAKNSLSLFSKFNRFLNACT